MAGMTNGEKIAYLRRYRQAVAYQRDLTERIAVLRSRAETVTASLTGMPGGHSSAGDAAYTRCVEQMDRERQKLCDAVRRCCETQAAVCGAIEAVPDGALRRLLYLRYISGYTWERIAVEMSYTYKWVCSLHGRALDVLEIEKST